MISSDLKLAFFKVGLYDTFTIVNKNKVPAGYSIVDCTIPEVLSVYQTKPDFISNEDVIKQVREISGLAVEWFFYDKSTFIFYLPQIPFTHNKYIIQPYLEVVNSYDGHHQRQVNWTFRINGQYLFTDHKVMDWENGKLKYITYMDISKYITYKLFTSFEITSKRILNANVPNKLKDLIPGNHLGFESNIELVESHLPLINKWTSSSFLQARNYSIKLYNNLF